MTTVAAHLGQSLYLVDQLNQQFTLELEQQLLVELAEIQRLVQAWEHASFVFKVEYEVQRNLKNPVHYNFPLFAALVGSYAPELHHWFAFRVSVYGRDCPDSLLLSVVYNPVSRQFTQEDAPKQSSPQQRKRVLEARQILLDYFEWQHQETTVR